MDTTDLAFSSAVEQAALVRGGDVSPVELVELYLERIEEIDPEVGAYVTVMADHAREEAQAAEALIGSDDLPPFHGVPISIKDLNLHEGFPVKFGSPAFEDFIAPLDEHAVAALRGAGFIALGKTNVPEFGLLPWTEPEIAPPTRNPWDRERTAGGSSGGAAAAVAAGLCPVSQGSDGGGSIRIPASCNGVFGLKPSRGRVSHAPMFGDMMNGLTTIGPITRTVEDAAAMLDVLSGYVTGDPYWAAAPERSFLEETALDPGKLKIGIVTESTLAEVDPICRIATEEAADLLESLGHEIIPVAVSIAEHVIGAFTAVWVSGAASIPVPDWEKVGRHAREIAALGNNVTAAQYLQAIMVLQAFSREVVAGFDEYDLLLSPTLSEPPIPVGAHTDKSGAEVLKIAGRFAPFPAIWNITGQPAVALPLHWSDDGLPIGVQIAGPPAGEPLLIRLSAQVEAARPWRDRRPPLGG